MIPKIPKNIDDTFEKGLEKATEAGNKTIETATNQSDETTQAFLDQLYGPTNPSPQSGSEQSGHMPQPNPENPQQQTPAMEHLQTEQEKLAKARQQLNQFDVNYNKQFGLEQELARVRQAKEAEEAQKKQAEAAEAERARQEAAEKMQQVQAPAGKKTGMQPGAQRKSQEVQDLDAQRARQAIENKSGFKG